MSATLRPKITIDRTFSGIKKKGAYAVYDIVRLIPQKYAVYADGSFPLVRYPIYRTELRSMTLYVIDRIGTLFLEYEKRAVYDDGGGK